MSEFELKISMKPCFYILTLSYIILYWTFHTFSITKWFINLSELDAFCEKKFSLIMNLAIHFQAFWSNEIFLSTFLEWKIKINLKIKLITPIESKYFQHFIMKRKWSYQHLVKISSIFSNSFLNYLHEKHQIDFFLRFLY